MHSLTIEDVEMVDGGMSVEAGIGALAVAVGAGAIVTIAPAVAGAAAIGLIGIAAIDIYNSLN